jgi:hypothetical protein
VAEPRPLDPPTATVMRAAAPQRPFLFIYVFGKYIDRWGGLLSDF